MRDRPRWSVSSSKGRKYVQEQGWCLERELFDRARSAFHGANRAEGADLHQFEIEAREGLHAGKVLCVENLDRLSRQGIKAAAKLVWALNDSGVDVATWHDGHIYRAKSDSDLLDILYIATKAQRSFDESDAKSKRGRDTWEDRYANIAAKKPGTRSGRPPAWLVWDGQHYQPHPHRAAVLNEIFDLYLQGLGTYRIVQLLNARGEPAWPNRKEATGGWYLAYVHSLLKNRSVLGEYTTLSGETIATDYYPRVITIEKFTQANELLAGRAKRGGRDFQRFNNLLSGLVRCAKCEGTGAYENKGVNSVTKYVDAKGATRTYARKHYEKLRCDNNRRRKGCDNHALFEYRVVEQAVLDQLLSLTTEDDARSTHCQLLDEDIARAVRDIEIAEKRLANLIDEVADGAGKAIRKRADQLEADIEVREQQLSTLRTQREAEASRPTVIEDTAMIAAIRSELTSDEQSVRLAARTRTNSALRRLVDAVYLGDDGTFTILADIAAWQFNGSGEFMAGQAI